MLKKCLRYDLKSVFTYWIFGALTVLVLSFPAGLTLRSFINNINNPSHFPWEIFVLIMAGFALAAFVILSELLVYIRFYKHFYSDEGYLTFTLPVKRRTLFTSKVINGVIWQISSLLVVTVCMTIVTAFIPQEPSTSMPEVTEPIISAGWIFAYFLEVIVLIVLLSLVSVLSMYLIISIGANIVRKYKVLATIGIAYGASMVLSVISYIISLVGVVYIFSIIELFPSGASNIGLLIFFALAFIIVVLFTIALGLAYASLRIIERKLNLA